MWCVAGVPHPDDSWDLSRVESYDSAWLLIEAFGSTWDVDLGDVDFDAPITYPLDGDS